MYNGSLLSISSRQLFVYRHEDDPGLPPYKISAHWADQPDKSWLLNIGTYDPRLINHNGHILMFSTDHTRVHMGTIKTENMSYFNDRKLETNFKLQKHEKNWLPFTNQDELYLVYKFQPHIILNCDPITAYCRQEYSTPCSLKWQYGIISGGSSPILIGDEYLSFFHSWRETASHGPRIYYVGAYTFQDKPPFGILRYTTSPLWQKDFYTTPSPSKHKVLFPTSAFLDKDDVIMVYGENDATTKQAKFNLEELSRLMVINK